MKRFSHPQRVIDQLVPLAGLQIADFGAASGNYTLLLARKADTRAGAAIYAVDIQKEQLERLAQQAQEEALSGVHIVWGDLEEAGASRLRDASLDLVLIANTLFQIKNKKTILAEAYRVLGPEGRLALVDWSDSFGHIGPHSRDVVPVDTAKSLCENAGFQIDRDLDAGEHHYGFIATKKDI